MIKRKIATFLLCASLLGTNLSFSSTAFASSVNSNVTYTQNDTLTKADEANIKESINEVLSFKYEILKTGKSKNYSDIIKNPKLLELINAKSKLDVEWFKKFDGKTDEYISNVNIINSSKTAFKTYVINVNYNVEFKIKGTDVTSKSGEKYRFEVKGENGKWYITKMLNLNETNESKNNQLKQEVFLDTDNNFSDYEDKINLELKNINDNYENMDENYNNFIQSTPNNNNSENRLAGRSYANFNYNAKAAVSYAQKYGKDPNPNYVYSRDSRGKGVDCTNFVSQCVLAGGIPASSYWYAYSNSWVRVIDFWSYMTSNGYGSTVEGVRGDGTQGARAGDVVQFANNLYWSHSVILSGTILGGQWVYCGHSDERLDYPLYIAYDEGGYKRLRTLKFWH